MLDCCRNRHISCLHNPFPHRCRPDSVLWASRPSLPTAWLALLLTKAGDVDSNSGSTIHTDKHTPVIWICDLCHKQINKKQTSIRCNHTHKTHWVHLNCTHMKQRQYKPEMHHSYTHTKQQSKHRQHNFPSQTNHHPPTHKQQSPKGHKHRHTSNQYKRHQKQNRGIEKPSTQHPTGYHHNT